MNLIQKKRMFWTMTFAFLILLNTTILSSDRHSTNPHLTWSSRLLSVNSGAQKKGGWKFPDRKSANYPPARVVRWSHRRVVFWAPRVGGYFPPRSQSHANSQKRSVDGRGDCHRSHSFYFLIFWVLGNEPFFDRESIAYGFRAGCRGVPV